MTTQSDPCNGLKNMGKGKRYSPGHDLLWRGFLSSFWPFGNSLHNVPAKACLLLHSGLTQDLGQSAGTLQSKQQD